MQSLLEGGLFIGTSLVVAPIIQVDDKLRHPRAATCTRQMIALILSQAAMCAAQALVSLVGRLRIATDTGVIAAFRLGCQHGSDRLFGGLFDFTPWSAPDLSVHTGMIARCVHRLFERLVLAHFFSHGSESLLELSALGVAVDHFFCCTKWKLTKSLIRNKPPDELRPLL